MKNKTAVNVVGAGRYGQWLANNAALISDVTFSHWSPGPNGEDLSIVRQQANAARIPFTPSCTALLSDPAPVILVLTDKDRTQILQQGLRSGKTLVCASPPTRDEADLRMIQSAVSEGGGRLLCGEWIGHTQAGSQAAKIVRNDDFGKLHSMYLSIRMPRRPMSDTDIVQEAGWPAFDFVLSCVPGSVQSVYVCGGPLFNAEKIDTAICLIRFDTDVIATVELSRCLPATFPAALDGEVEFELIGANKTLRTEPNKAAVNVFGDERAKSQPWTEEALVGMLREAIRPTVPNAVALAHLEKLIELMSMARQSIDEGRPIYAEG